MEEYALLYIQFMSLIFQWGIRILGYPHKRKFEPISKQKMFAIFKKNKVSIFIFSLTLSSWNISLFFKFNNFTNIKVIRLKNFESAWMDKELRFLFPLHNITQEWSFFSNLLKCARDNNPQKNRKQIIITKKEKTKLYTR